MGPQSEGGPPGPAWAYGGPPPSGEDNRYQSSRDMGPSGYPQQQQQQQQQFQQQQQNMPRQNQNNGFDQGNRGPPPASMQVGQRNDDRGVGEAHKDGSDRDRSRHRGGKRTGSGQLRLCKKCGEPLTGQFVRALGGTFHLDCFKCKVSSPIPNCVQAVRNLLTDRSVGLRSDRRVKILPGR